MSTNPADWTPNVLDEPSSVRSVAQTGNTMIAGGNFTKVQNAGSSVTLTRNRVFAFNATTGLVSTTFAPNVDDMVRSVLPAPGGSTVYLGGEFKHVNGGPQVSLVSLNISNGSINTAFQVPALNGRVYAMRLANNRLYIAGAFTTVGGYAIRHLAALDPVTGAVDTAFKVNISGFANPAPRANWVTHLIAMDVSPDGTRMVIAGDYDIVNGQARPQIAMLDLTAVTPALIDWQTNQFVQICHSNWESTVLDVEFSPDGGWFAVATGGGYSRDQASGCDSSSRWETAARGSNLQPTWIDYTGGDTLWSVAISGSAVYTGGHNRWQNNAYGEDSAGPGAIPRPGLGALDPRNGLPFSWNPGRTLGVGVFDLLATPAGLWVANDTNLIAGEFHAKLAFFPAAGGSAVPRPSAGTLPSSVIQLGRSGTAERAVGTCGSSTANADDTAKKRNFDGTNDGPLTTVSSQNTAWGQARGAFMLSGVLYTGWPDGTLCRRTFNGTSFGPQQLIDFYNSKFRFELPTLTGMFFTGNRLYFTVSGTNTLFYRYFTPQDDAVGAVAYAATNGVTGIDFSKVKGMFPVGSKLYFVTRTDGVLRRIDWNGKAPVPNTMVAISGPGVDGAASWASQALTLYAAAGAVAANVAPKAVMTTACAAATCRFVSAGSSDEDGTVTAYSWTFGDGSTSGATSPTHTYLASGTYSVTLKVTDDLGGTNSVTRSVTIGNPGPSPISFLAVRHTTGNGPSWSVQVPSNVLASDGLILTASANTAATSLSAPSGWSLIRKQTAGDLATRVWQRVATAADTGKTITLTASAPMKATVVLLVYRGTATSAPIGKFAAASDTTLRSTHTTPTATAATTGSWVVSLWADRSSVTTSMTPPSGQRQRFLGCGTGSGHICTMLTDIGPVNAGTQVGGKTATANAPSNANTMWTIVLAP